MVEYVFQGQPRTSKPDIEDGPCSPTKTSVERTIEQYGKGVVVTAFANPQKPSAIWVANYSLGTNFYLMLRLAISLFAGVVYIWRTRANKLVNRDGNLRYFWQRRCLAGWCSRYAPPASKIVWPSRGPSKVTSKGSAAGISSTRARVSVVCYEWHVHGQLLRIFSPVHQCQGESDAALRCVR